MVQLLRVADDMGLTMLLSPTNDWGASAARLTKFYASLGFVRNHGRRKNFLYRDTMYRLPPAQ